MNGTNFSDQVILNVDDYEPGRYARTRVLGQMGFRVVEAGTGQEALDLAERHKPILTLLDVNLPDVHGFEVCRRLRSNPETAALTIVHISASSIMGKHQARGLDSGADGYIVEPVEPGAKLLFQGFPGDSCGLYQGVKPISEPCVNVQRHRIVGNGADRALLKRHRMSTQALEEGYRKAGVLSEERALGRVLIFEKNRRFHNVMGLDSYSSRLPNLKCQPAAAYALGLVPHVFEAPAADWDAHLLEPISEAPTEFHISGIGAERLGLEPQ